MNRYSWLVILLIWFQIFTIGSCTSVRHIEKTRRAGFVYDKTVIEIQPFQGNEPYPDQLNHLRELLHDYKICPSNTITFVIRDPVVISNNCWFRNQLDPYEEQYRQLHDPDPNDRELILWMGFFPGAFVDPNHSNTIGLHYHPTSTLIMGWTINSDKRVGTMLHEILHVVGLVNRKNQNTHGSHCTNSSCTMYWLVPETPKLCDDCKAEIIRLAHDGS